MASMPPAAVRNPLRRMLVVNRVQQRWPFALRAAFCTAVPVLVGWAAGDINAGLTATLGSFTALYGSGRPFAYRAGYLATIVACFAAVVALGDWVSGIPWLAIVTVSAIAAVATLLCNALAVGPPGAYMFVLTCAAATGLVTAHIPPWRLALLVLAGGGFAWLVHMAGAAVRFRGPENAAIALAAEAVARYVDAVGTVDEASERHGAATALHDSWTVLVNFQPVRTQASRTLTRLRAINRELHIIFATAMNAAVDGVEPPSGDAERARSLGRPAGQVVIPDVGVDRADVPLGRPSPAELVREAVRPGSPALANALRAGAAALIAGACAAGLGIDHAYWAMAAAVLILHQGFDRVRTLQRGTERLLGTAAGLGLAGVVLESHPQGWWLVLMLAALQFAIEMAVVRNYAVAVMFITPTALTISAGTHQVTDVGALLLARGVDTLIGCAVAVTVYLLATHRRDSARLPQELARVLDDVATAARHLASGSVTSAQARVARRDLQIHAIALLATRDNAAAGSTRARQTADRLWPAVAATQRLAYRILAACWLREHRSSDVSVTFPPEALGPFTDATKSLSEAARTSSVPPALPVLPSFGAADLQALHDSLVHDTAIP